MSRPGLQLALYQAYHFVFPSNMSIFKGLVNLQSGGDLVGSDVAIGCGSEPIL
jgi:hypothetical protein